MLYQERGDTAVTNLYNIRLINKTHKKVPVTLKIMSGRGTIQMIGKEIVVDKTSKAESTFFIVLPKSAVTKRKTPITIGIYSGNERLETLTTNFLGPIQ